MSISCYQILPGSQSIVAVQWDGSAKGLQKLLGTENVAFKPWDGRHDLVVCRESFLCLDSFAYSTSGRKYNFRGAALLVGFDRAGKFADATTSPRDMLGNITFERFIENRASL